MEARTPMKMIWRGVDGCRRSTYDQSPKEPVGRGARAAAGLAAQTQVPLPGRPARTPDIRSGRPSPSENAAGVVTIPAVGVAGQEVKGSEVADLHRAFRGDAGPDRSDWERAWVIILTCIGIGTEATARYRGFGSRNPRRGERSGRAPLGHARSSSWSSPSRTMPRFPLTRRRGDLRPGSLVTAAKVPVGK